MRNQKQINHLRENSRRVGCCDQKLTSGAVESFDCRIGPNGLFVIWTVTGGKNTNDSCQVLVPTPNNWSATFDMLGLKPLSEEQQTSV